MVLGDCVGKERLVGDTVAAAPAAWPESRTVRGLPTELSVMVRVPVRVPVTVGVKVTWIAQVPPAAKTVPQPF